MALAIGIGNGVSFGGGGPGGAAAAYIPSAVAFHPSTGLTVAAGTGLSLVDSPYTVFAGWMFGTCGSTLHNTDNTLAGLYHGLLNVSAFGNIGVGSYDAEANPGHMTLWDNSGTIGLARLNYNDATGGANHRALGTYGTFLNGQWFHFLIATDLAHAAGSKFVSLAINGVQVATSVTDTGIGSFSPNIANARGWGVNQSNLAAKPGGAFWCADVALDVGTNVLDGSGNINAAFLAKFCKPDGSPGVDPGADGTAWFGHQAAVLLTGDKSGFITNKGYAGTAALNHLGTTTLGIYNAGYGPTGPTQPAPGWATTNYVTVAGTDTQVAAGVITNDGNPIVAGDLIEVGFLMEDNNGSVDRNFTVPSGWTATVRGPFATGTTGWGTQNVLILHKKVGVGGADITANGADWTAPVIAWPVADANIYQQCQWWVAVIKGTNATIGTAVQAVQTVSSPANVKQDGVFNDITTTSAKTLYRMYLVLPEWDSSRITSFALPATANYRLSPPPGAANAGNGNVGVLICDEPIAAASTVSRTIALTGTHAGATTGDPNVRIGIVFSA